MSEEAKARIAAAMTGRRDSDETREKKRQGRLGKRHTAEAIEKVRAAALQRPPRTYGPMPQAQRDAISAALAGKKRPPRGPTPADVKAKIATAHRVPLVERFFTHADQSSDCWLWLGSIKNSGYGMAYVGMREDGRQEYRTAHRVAYELSHGPIPSGMHVLHSCDVKRCVRPEHLRLGTQTENMRDMAAKRRQWKQRPAAP